MKTKHRMGHCPEGRITDPRDTRLVETSWGQRKTEGPYEGDQGPKGYVAPNVDGFCP